MASKGGSENDGGMSIVLYGRFCRSLLHSLSIWLHGDCGSADLVDTYVLSAVANVSFHCTWPYGWPGILASTLATTLSCCATRHMQGWLQEQGER